MEKQENIIYTNLLERLQTLVSSDIYLNEISQFLNEVDSIILNMSVTCFDEDFLLSFYGLLEQRTEKETIGEVFLNYYLSKKEKLPPSLILYFYMKQKDNLGFKDSYNRFKIGAHDIAYTDHEEDKHLYYNFYYHLQNYQEPDMFNYQCMENIMHELVHIYQFSIDPNTSDMYEKIICNDREIFLLSGDTGILNYGALHDDYLIEHHANVWSKHFMITFAKRNPDYFNETLIASKEEEFIKKANRNSYYGGQRRSFHKYMEHAFDMISSIIQSDKGDEEQYAINQKKMEELLRKDLELLSYIDTNVDYHDPVQHIYLGLGTYGTEVLADNFSELKK